MNGKYEYLDHTADIAVRIEAGSLDGLFFISAEVLKECQADNISFIKTDNINISLCENSTEELLVGFLSELNFLFSAKKWLFNKINHISIQKANDGWKLDTLIEGSRDAKYELKNEIKAVTFNQMEIVELHGRYSTVIVFDI